MFRKLGCVLMIFAVLAATDIHWLVLQSIAWTTMLAKNLQNDSFGDSVHRTFDGKHPCCLCKEIAKGKQSEKKTDLQAELKPLEFSYTNNEFVFCPPSNFYEIRAADEMALLLTRAPAVPPPKAILG